MSEPRLPRGARWLLLALLPLLATLFGLLFGGAAGAGPGEALAVLLGRDLPEGRAALLEVLVFEVRMPRVVLLLLAGAALSAAGATLQASLQNPLADPGLLGLSGGAALGAVVAHSLGLAERWAPAVPGFAFAGALVALLGVYALAHLAGRPTTGTLLLTGIAVASLTSAGVSVLLLAAGTHRVHQIFAWLLGSAAGRTWDHVQLAVGPVVVGLLLLAGTGRIIDALALGEEHALGVGVDVLRGRAVLFALIALTAGSAVAVVGPIGFVGLMVPHMVRVLTGPEARRLLPACVLAGSAFLVVCDAASRIVSRTFELPVGIVTALAGVPFFLALLHRRRRF
jgi:iron complex transport system permease protein